MRRNASRNRAKRSFGSGHLSPLAGTSFSDSPVPTPSTTRPGNRSPSVAKPCATTDGMITEGRRQHACAHDDPRCLGPERAKPRERKRRVSVGVPPRLKVIADENGIEAGFFRKTREGQKIARTELFRGRFVTELKHLVSAQPCIVRDACRCPTMGPARALSRSLAGRRTLPWSAHHACHAVAGMRNWAHTIMHEAR